MRDTQTDWLALFSWRHSFHHEGPTPVTASKPNYLTLRSGASACGLWEVGTLQFMALLVGLALCCWTSSWKECGTTEWRATKSIMSDCSATIDVILWLVVIIKVKLPRQMLSLIRWQDNKTKARRSRAKSPSHLSRGRMEPYRKRSFYIGTLEGALDCN